MPAFFTIGHLTRSIDAFVAIVLGTGVDGHNLAECFVRLTGGSKR